MLEGWQVPHVPPNPEFRHSLNTRLATEGLPALAEELRRVNPEAAARIDLKNPRRVVRALEVAAVAGGGPPPRAGERPPLGRGLVLGIGVPREELHRRIDIRVDAMFAAGLVEEVRALTARGKGCGTFAFTAIGYREVCRFLAGETTLDEARESTKLATHRLARTQAGWFRRTDPRIIWLDAGPGLEARAQTITAEFLRGREAGDETPCSS
jgi:tRNA dimethylallyltransferase